MQPLSFLPYPNMLVHNLAKTVAWYNLLPVRMSTLACLGVAFRAPSRAY
jgi:hypothetical protein